MCLRGCGSPPPLSLRLRRFVASPLLHHLCGTASMAPRPRHCVRSTTSTGSESAGSVAAPPRLRLCGYVSRAPPLRYRLRNTASTAQPPSSIAAAWPPPPLSSFRLHGSASASAPLRHRLCGTASTLSYPGCTAPAQRLWLRGSASAARPPWHSLHGTATAIPPLQLRLHVKPPRLRVSSLGSVETESRHCLCGSASAPRRSYSITLDLPP